MALTDDAIARIKHQIVSGAWGPGDRLSPEHELAEQMGISRNSLREAVKALAFLGVLDVRHGGGTYVTSLEPDILLTSLAFVTDMHDERALREMFDIRRVLEIHAAEEAARRATPEQIAALRAELKSAAELADPHVFLTHGAHFHHLLCELSGNRYLDAFVSSLNARPLLERTQAVAIDAATAERTAREHEEIVDAIAAGNAKLAGEINDRHISDADLWVDVAS